MTDRANSRIHRQDTEITLLDIDSPPLARNDRTIALPIHSWLSAQFWDLFGLPSVEWALSALTFGTENAPRTYVARYYDYPTTWTSEPLAVNLPVTLGPGPGVLEVSGPMTWARRRLVERTTLVIALATPFERRLHTGMPEQLWEEDRWHTTVLVPDVRPGAHSPQRYSESW
ncbi:hypothetical protein [Nocardia sp. CA-290969]|uniref:hypothetical protein n=1 Tax=Nocardia sp. CA-290969 TaxID=3239986 RepID=UPI003D94DD78